MSWQRIGWPHCGHTGAVPRAVAAQASTLHCSAANICGRYAISTSRSSNQKRGGSSAKTGRVGGMVGSGRTNGCRDMAPLSTAAMKWNGGMDGCADSGRAPKAGH